MTVVYSDFKDTDTGVLRRMWQGLDNITLITNGPKERIGKALREEKDTLLLCGHGTSGGLWMPEEGNKDLSFPFRYAISKDDVPLIKAKYIIGIWCYASLFAEKCCLRGFYSSMFISSEYEAAVMGIEGMTAEEITRSEILFCNRINKLLREGVPLFLWTEILQKEESRNEVERFNYSGLRYRS